MFACNSEQMNLASDDNDIKIDKSFRDNELLWQLLFSYTSSLEQAGPTIEKAALCNIVAVLQSLQFSIADSMVAVDLKFLREIFSSFDFLTKSNDNPNVLGAAAKVLGALAPTIKSRLAFISNNYGQGVTLNDCKEGTAVFDLSNELISRPYKKLRTSENLLADELSGKTQDPELTFIESEARNWIEKMAGILLEFLAAAVGTGQVDPESKLGLAQWTYFKEPSCNFPATLSSEDGMASRYDITITLLSCLQSIRQASKAGSLSVEALPAIKNCLRTHSHTVRQVAVQLLPHVSCRVKKYVRSEAMQDSQEAENQALLLQDSINALQNLLNDPFPGVRALAIQSLMQMRQKGVALQESCFVMAGSLLDDQFEDVRSAAVILIGTFAQQRDGKFSYSPSIGHLADKAFLQVSSRASDMSKHVRESVFVTLEAMNAVSSRTLMLSLSKKVPRVQPGNSVQKNSSSVRGGDEEEDFTLADEGAEHNFLEMCAAGAFVHGLEDEFWEVRSAALAAMESLSSQSAEFAAAASCHLADMLYDSVERVRMRALHALLQCVQGHAFAMKPQNTTMVLGVLEDASIPLRNAALSVLASTTLPTYASLQSCSSAIMACILRHPQEEAASLDALAAIAAKHVSFVEVLAPEFLSQAEQARSGDAGIDDLKYVALLALLLAAAAVSPNLQAVLPPSMLRDARVLFHRLPSAAAHGLSSIADGNLLGPRFPSPKLRSAHVVASKEQRDCPGLPSSEVRLVESANESELVFLESALAAAHGVQALVALQKHTEGLRVLRYMSQKLSSLTGSTAGGKSAINFASLHISMLVVFLRCKAELELPKWNLKALGRFVKKLEEISWHLHARFRGQSCEYLSILVEVRLVIALMNAALSGLANRVVPKDNIHSTASTSDRWHQDKAKKLLTGLKTASSLIRRECTAAGLNVPMLSNFDHFIAHPCDLGSPPAEAAASLALTWWPCPIGSLASVKEVWAEMTCPLKKLKRPLEIGEGLPFSLDVEAAVYNIDSRDRLWVETTAEPGEGSKFYVAIAPARIDGRHLSLGKDMASEPYYLGVASTFEHPPLNSPACRKLRIRLVIEYKDGGARDSPRAKPSSLSRRRGPQGLLVPLCAYSDIAVVDVGNNVPLRAATNRK